MIDINTQYTIKPLTWNVLYKKNTIEYRCQFEFGYYSITFKHNTWKWIFCSDHLDDFGTIKHKCRNLKACKQACFEHYLDMITAKEI